MCAIKRCRGNAAKGLTVLYSFYLCAFIDNFY
jgi:hypothetical protein